MGFHGRNRAETPAHRGLEIGPQINRTELLENMCQTACKPGSVPGGGPPMDGHSSGTPVAGRLARPTRTRRGNAPARRPGSLFDLAPGGVCLATAVTGGAVRSYRTLSPLPGLPKGGTGRFAFCGTFPRVAPAGHYPAPCSRGARTFLPPGLARSGERPSGHLAHSICGPDRGAGQPPAAASSSQASRAASVPSTGPLR